MESKKVGSCYEKLKKTKYRNERKDNYEGKGKTLKEKNRKEG